MPELLSRGQILGGRYRVERFLAEGGFGAVYVAEQIETESRVALKVLWPHILRSAEAVKRFKLEARIAGRVGGDHIVKVLDAQFDDGLGVPFMVMELLVGEELEKLFARTGTLPPDLLANLMRQVASALDKAHGYVNREGQAQPIIHRDLKPDNIFITYRETGEPLVKVLDFGIAKVLTESTGISKEIKGTPLYMSFEQVMGERMSPQTDIWALGLIAFYLLTGKSYWKTANHPDGTTAQLLGEILSHPLPPASQRAFELGVPVRPPDAFDPWFGRCVNRDPARRFSTAGECAAALAHALVPVAVQPTVPFVRPPRLPQTLDSTAPAAARPSLSRANGARSPQKAGPGRYLIAAVTLGAALLVAFKLIPNTTTPTAVTESSQTQKAAAGDRPASDGAHPAPNPTQVTSVAVPAGKIKPEDINLRQSPPNPSPIVAASSIITIGPATPESSPAGLSKIIAIEDKYIYLQIDWQNASPSIGKLPQKGGPLKIFQPEWGHPSVVTMEEGVLYWIELNGRIQSWPLEGGEVKTIDQARKNDRELILWAESIYWCDTTGGRIMSGSVGGGGLKPEVTGQVSPSGMAAWLESVAWVTQDRIMERDPYNGSQLVSRVHGARQVYVLGGSIVWTTDDSIQKAGSDVDTPTTVASGQRFPSDVQDDERNYYWLNEGQVMRVTKGGGAPVLLVNGEGARSLRLDSGSLYWVSSTHSAVKTWTPP